MNNCIFWSKEVFLMQRDLQRLDYRSLSRMCVLWVVNGGKDSMIDADIQIHISANVAMHAYKKK